MEGLLNHPWISRRKIDVVEYHRMGAAGILHEDDRVELIEGELIAMAPIGDHHAGTSMTLTTPLVRAVGDDAIVSVGNPVRLDSYNEPQPISPCCGRARAAIRGATPARRTCCC